MKPADSVVVCFSDGRPPLRRRDLIRDNRATMQREYLSMDGKTVTCFISADLIEQKSSGKDLEPWGTYF